MDGEDRGKPTASRAPAVGVEHGGEGALVEQAEPLGLVDRPLERMRCDDGGEIEECPRRRGDRKGAVTRDLAWRETTAVDPHSSAAFTTSTAADRHVGEARVGGTEPPKFGGGAPRRS